MQYCDVWDTHIQSQTLRQDALTNTGRGNQRSTVALVSVASHNLAFSSAKQLRHDFIG